MNIYDIAGKAGVSIATVSRVINGGAVSEQTRRKVKAVMKELGYTPNVFARGLMVNSMKTIGILTADVRDLYYARAIQTIEGQMREKGYDVLLCSTGEDLTEKKKYLQLLLRKKVDGVILIGSVFREKGDNSHILEASRLVPVVTINGDVQGDNLYTVFNDDCDAVCSAVTYLAEKGHRKMVYVYDADTFSGNEKIKGFKKGMQNLGLEVTPGSVLKTAAGIQGGFRAAQKLLEEGIEFTAVLTSEDVLAAGIMKKLRETGRRVPQDVAVIGYGNSVIAESTNPELTSIDNKVEAISSSAAKTMMDVLEGKNLPHKTMLMSELVIRQSS